MADLSRGLAIGLAVAAWLEDFQRAGSVTDAHHAFVRELAANGHQVTPTRNGHTGDDPDAVEKYLGPNGLRGALRR